MKRFLSVFLSITFLMTSAMFTPVAAAPGYGDADNNGVINIVDVALLLNKVMTDAPMPIEANADYLRYMDLDGDGMLASSDVAELLQMVLDSTYKPVAVPETTEATTETTTEATTEITTVTTTEATTETTTVTTTETTTVATTEATTETTTEAATGSDVNEQTGLPVVVTGATGEIKFPLDKAYTGEVTVDMTFSVDAIGGIGSIFRLRSSDGFDHEAALRLVTLDGACDLGKAASGIAAGTLVVGENHLKLTLNTATGEIKSVFNGVESTRTNDVAYIGKNVKEIKIGSKTNRNLTLTKVTVTVPSTPAPVVTTEATTETTTAAITDATTQATTDATTQVTTENGSEVTTIDTSDGVVVSNFSDFKNEVAKKNNKVYVKGTIKCTERIRLQNSNSNTEIIGITNPDGTAAILDYAPFRDSLSSSGSGGTGIYMSGSGYTFKNIIIQNAGDCGIRITGSGSGYSTFENCVFRYNNNSGISVTNGGSNNTFRCVDSYRNGDLVQKNGADADGFSVKLNAGGNNKFYNCRAWENSDDGWDSYDRGTPYIGDIDYVECLAWNNGNPYVFTGEYDYSHNDPLDKNLLYVQAILKSNPDFEAQYNAHNVTSWPKVTVSLFNTSNNYDRIHSKSWAGNPNGFKFGSADTPSSSYRYIKNCIAFDHENTPNQKPAKGFDQNNGYAGYDIENALSFNNGQNYWMDRMSAKSAKGVFYSINSGMADAPGDLKLTTPDDAKAKQLIDTVYAYRDMIYDYVYNDKIPGEQICNVF